MENIVAIFEPQNGVFFWVDYFDQEDCFADYNIQDAKYFVPQDIQAVVHSSQKSVLYDDLTGYVDELQDEETLRNDELYVVVYFYYNHDDKYFGLEQRVDFGLTKKDIIDNVKEQKYLEGAAYYTMGQVFKATKDVLEELHYYRNNK